MVLILAIKYLEYKHKLSKGGLVTALAIEGAEVSMMEPISIVTLKREKKARVVSFLVSDGDQLRKLTAFGILPGVEIEVLQTYPTYVLKVGYTQIALDYEIVKNIMVAK